MKRLRARAAPVIDVHDISNEGSGPWRLLVNGYGVAMWPSAAARDDAEQYAHEAARVLRKALGVEP